MTGFLLFCTAPGQFVGGTIGGTVKKAAGGNWSTLMDWSEGIMLLGSVILLYSESKVARSRLRLSLDRFKNQPALTKKC